MQVFLIVNSRYSNSFCKSELLFLHMALSKKQAKNYKMQVTAFGHRHFSHLIKLGDWNNESCYFFLSQGIPDSLWFKQFLQWYMRTSSLLMEITLSSEWSLNDLTVPDLFLQLLCQSPAHLETWFHLICDGCKRINSACFISVREVYKYRNTECLVCHISSKRFIQHCVPLELWHIYNLQKKLQWRNLLSQTWSSMMVLVR